MKKILSLLTAIILLTSCTRTYIVWTGSELFGLTIVVLVLLVILFLYLKEKVTDWIIARAERKEKRKTEMNKTDLFCGPPLD